MSATRHQHAGSQPVPKGYDPLIGKGLCDIEPDAGHQCFMDDRAAQITQFKINVSGMAANFQAAINQVFTERTVAKEAELSLVSSLLIDVISSYLSSTLGALAKGAVRAKRPAASSAPPLDSAAPVSASEAVIDQGTRSAGRLAGRQATHAQQGIQNAGAADSKRAALGYLDQLSETASAAFHDFSMYAARDADDAGLVSLQEQANPSFHTVPKFVVLISSKLDRFLASGVTHIGREQATATREGVAHDVTRDTRVAWVTNRATGTPRALWFERMDGRSRRPQYPTAMREPSPAREFGDDEFAFGEAGATDPRLDRPVPQEFADAAIAKHIATWQTPPQELEVGVDGRMQRSAGARVPSPSQGLHEMLFGAD